MKKILAIFLTVVAMLLATQTANAQCVVDTTGCNAPFGAVCPSTLPGATLGNYYNQDVTFYMPSGFSLADLGIPLNVTFSQVVVVASNVPDGLTLSFNVPNATYDPNNTPYGCFNISGAPCVGGGTYVIDVLMSVTANIVVQTINMELPFQLELVVNSPYPSFDLAASSGFFCASSPQPIDLTVPTGAGFDSLYNYLWSTGATTDTIAVSTPGVYSVTATASGDTAVCIFTDSVVLDTIGAIINGASTICAGEFFQLQGGGGDFFAWSPTANLSNSTVANPVIIGLDSTTDFQLIVSNGQCSDTSYVMMTVDTTCGGTCKGCVATTDTCNATAFGSFCDNTITNIEAGLPYEGSITFSIPQYVDFGQVIQQFAGVSPAGLPLPDTLEVLWYEIFNVTGLPLGLNWECDQPGNNCRYYPGVLPDVTGTGCIKICGTTCDEPGQYPTAAVMKLKLANLPELIITIGVLVGGDQYDITDSTFLLPIAINPTVFYQNELTVSPAGPIDLRPDASITLVASSGLTGYSWAPNGDTTESIVVDAAGTYTVSAFDGNCTQDYSVTVVLKPWGVGIEASAQLSQSFNIFPNPNNGVFDVKFEVASRQNVTMDIFDINGKVVNTNQFGSITGQVTATVDMSTFSKGVYLVRLVTEEGTVNKKVTVF